MTEDRYVEISGGSQLAWVLRGERRYRQDGYVILPLNCGTGDPYEIYTEWIPKRFTRFADMSKWAYNPTANRWSKTLGISDERRKGRGIMVEYGLFNEGHCVDQRRFCTRREANEAKVEYEFLNAHSVIDIWELCYLHNGQPKNGCKVCIDGRW